MKNDRPMNILANKIAKTRPAPKMKNGVTYRAAGGTISGSAIKQFNQNR